MPVETACVVNWNEGRTPMKFNLRNRVNQTKLGRDQGLRPVFEAIANAFDAITEASPKGTGRITVRLLRGKTDQPPLPNTERTLDPVIGFEIEDDGIGFTDEHFDSFDEAYSERKSEVGGKGCGRFLWLVAFGRAEVESYYCDAADKLQPRHFAFTINKEVQTLNTEITKGKRRGTLVRLTPFINQYTCPINVETIGRHIIEHNLEQLLASDKISLILIDDNGAEINLRKTLNTDYKTTSKTVPLKVNGIPFTLRHVCVRAKGEIDAHRLHFCARHRSVLSEPVSKYIGDLRLPIDMDGQDVFYVGTISGKYLNEATDDARTNLLLPEIEGLDTSALTKRQIAEAAISKIREYFAVQLEQLRAKKKAKVESVVSHKAPELRAVVGRHPEILDKLKVDSDDKEILTAVSGQNYDDRDELKKMQLELLSKSNVGEQLESTEKALISRYASESSWQGEIALRTLVIHRRAVLDVLKNLVCSDDNWQYQKEEAIHQLVFPLRKTSDEVSPGLANLWIIDERLAFHYYLASDLRLDQLDPIQIEGTSGKEPDLIIFHHSFAVDTRPETPGAITIIEFKRPGRHQYDQEKNPYDQIQEYVNKILDGKARDRKNQPFTAMKGTRFYAYIIADMLPALVEILQRRGFKKGPGVDSWYTYESGIQLMVEAYSYKTLIEDSQKRNLAFFKALGIADY